MAKDVEILDKSEQYKGYFRINRYRLRHRLYAGGWSGELQRELFERGHAVGVLPYDPAADSVVLIEQFRIGALVAGMEPWLTEIVAGIIEEGEAPEEVARRETREEAGLEVIGSHAHLPLPRQPRGQLGIRHPLLRPGRQPRRRGHPWAGGGA